MVKYSTERSLGYIIMNIDVNEGFTRQNTRLRYACCAGWNQNACKKTAHTL